MAENEKKTQDTEVTEAASEKETKVAEKKESKPAKVKSDKPSIVSRAAAWFRATRAELKKIVWTPKQAVIRNTLLTLVVMAAFGLVIGLLDYAFSSAIVGLSLII